MLVPSLVEAGFCAVLPLRTEKSMGSAEDAADFPRATGLWYGATPWYLVGPVLIITVISQVISVIDYEQFII